MSVIEGLVEELSMIPFEVLMPPAGVLLFYLAGTRLLISNTTSRAARIVLLIADTIVIPTLLGTLAVLAERLPGGASAATNLRRVLQSLLVLTAVRLLDRYLGLFVWTRRFRTLRGAEAPMILRNLVSVSLYVLALALVAVFIFGRTASGILVSTGVLVGVIGFALQNLLYDLFAGIALTFDRPFDMGDWIQISDGTEGEVLQVNWKSTLVKSLNEGVYVIPNSKLSQSVVHNLSRPSVAHAMWVTISVDRRYPPDMVRKRLVEAALSTRAVLKEPAPSVNLTDATGNPFQYTVYATFESYPRHFSGRSELYLNIYSYLEHAGIETSAAKYEVATEQAPERVIARPTLFDELRGAEIFRMLDEEQIRELARRSAEQTYYPGEVLVREGERRSDLIIVTSGIVSVRKRQGRGGVEIARLGAGSVLGEMSLLTGAPRSATVSAYVLTSVIQVPKEALEPIVRDVPELAEEFGRIMVERQITADDLGQSLRQSERNTSEIVRESIDRFVGRIRHFFRLSGEPTETGMAEEKPKRSSRIARKSRKKEPDTRKSAPSPPTPTSRPSDARSSESGNEREDPESS
ncbi:MAG: cyclic nucleotide-binding domain-containing protein [Spirochaetales bacterium]